MLWIEYAAQLAHGVERSLGKDRFHVTHLVEPNSMLTGDASAGVNARLHDLSHCLVNSLALGRIIGAVGNVGMKISVAGVEDIANHHAVLLTDGVDGGENLWQLRSRDHRVLNNEVRPEATHRPNRLLSALPQLHSLGVIPCDAH